MFCLRSFNDYFGIYFGLSFFVLVIFIVLLWSLPQVTINFEKDNLPELNECKATLEQYEEAQAIVCPEVKCVQSGTSVIWSIGAFGILIFSFIYYNGKEKEIQELQKKANGEI